MSRHQNNEFRKVCGCARRTWPKCPHSSQLNYNPRGKAWRISLGCEVGKHVDSKSDAIAAGIQQCPLNYAPLPVEVGYESRRVRSRQMEVKPSNRRQTAIGLSDSIPSQRYSKSVSASLHAWSRP